MYIYSIHVRNFAYATRSTMRKQKMKDRPERIKDFIVGRILIWKINRTEGFDLDRKYLFLNSVCHYLGYFRLSHSQAHSNINGYKQHRYVVSNFSEKYNWQPCSLKVSYIHWSITRHKTLKNTPGKIERNLNNNFGVTSEHMTPHNVCLFD